MATIRCNSSDCGEPAEDCEPSDTPESESCDHECFLLECGNVQLVVIRLLELPLILEINPNGPVGTPYLRSISTSSATNSWRCGKVGNSSGNCIFWWSMSTKQRFPEDCNQSNAQ